MSFSQQDSKWAKTLLGYNTDPHFNLANFGCLVTAYANMLATVTGEAKYTPIFVNDWLKANNGFLPDGGVMVWSVAAKMGFVEPKGTMSDPEALKRFLKDPPNYAIMEVRAGGSQHFVLGINTVQIIDSLDGKTKSIATYPFVNAHLYTVVGGKGNGTVMPQGEDMKVTRQMAELLEHGFLLRPTTDEEFIRSVEGQDIVVVMNALLASQERRAIVDRFNQTRVQLDFRTTYRPDPQVRVAVSSGVAHDFAGAKPDQAVVEGMQFDQAGTFVVDGKTYVRTQLSVVSGDWYGTPLELFGDPEVSISLTPGQTLHLKLSEVYGLFKRLQTNATNLIKGEKS